MPEYGQLGVDKIPFTMPFMAPLYPAPPWKFEDSEILLMSYEIDKDLAESSLPPALSRSYPPYGHIMVSHCPSSPVGPFSHATQMVVCRWRTTARAFPLLTIVSTEAACAAFREFWAFPAKLGDVSLERNGDGVSASIARGGQALANVRVTDLEEVTAGEMRYDPMMNPRIVRAAREEDEPPVLELDQIDPDYTYKQTWRGQGDVEFPAASDDDPWHLMENRNHIATTFAVCDTELGFARYVVAYDEP